MKSYEQLPEGYKEILHIDLQKDKKLMLIVNLLGLIPAVLMGVFLGPIIVYLMVIRQLSPEAMLYGLLGALAGMAVYVVLHEWVHAVFMRRFCTARVKFGFTGMYAYAGSAGYYCRRHYLIIALAPVVIWGTVLAVLNVVLPMVCFLPVYLIQLVNLSGAGGDLYVFLRFRKLPEDILIQDSGVAMTVFSREG